MGGGRRGRGWGGGGGGGEGLGFWMGEGGRRHSLTSARLPGRTWRWLGIVLWGWGGEGVPRLSSRITSSPARHKICHTPDSLLHSRLNLSKDHGGISEPATSKSRTKKRRFSTQPYQAASAAAGPTLGPCFNAHRTNTKHGSNPPDERAIEGLNIKGDYRNDM